MRETVPISRRSVARWLCRRRLSPGQPTTMARDSNSREKIDTCRSVRFDRRIAAWFPYIGTQRRQKTAACWSCSALLRLCVCQASSLHSRSQGGANDFTIVMSLDRTNEGGTVSFCSCARGRLFSFNGGLNTLMTIVQLHSLDLVGNIAV